MGERGIKKKGGYKGKGGRECDQKYRGVTDWKRDEFEGERVNEINAIFMIGLTLRPLASLCLIPVCVRVHMSVCVCVCTVN